MSTRVPKLLTTMGLALALSLSLGVASVSAAPPGAGTCSGGPIAGGTYNGFSVTGKCFAAPGATVQINGDLTVADGAVLNDHGAEGFVGAQMHITGNVHVGKGAILGLGYNVGDGFLGPDTVGGSIIANQPLTLYVGELTVGGSLISNGGGLLSTSKADFRNFPVKDNVIHGNLIIQGWQGGWIGVIRNHVDGNVIVAKNVSLSNPETGPGTDPDAMEVQTNTVSGNLICHGNTPAAHINPVDGGLANTVGGNAIGECAALAG